MTTSTANTYPVINLPAVGSGLVAYINSLEALPVLSEEEERALAIRLRDFNDAGAARRLVMANLRLVVSVSRKYSGYGLNQADLIQEGNIGLMKAVRKFDPTRGARLATFAVYWIKAEIQEFIIRNWRIVKIATTKAQRKLFFSKNRLGRGANGRNADAVALAKELDVTPEDITEMRGRLHNTETVALLADDEDNPGSEAYLADAAGVNVEDEMEARWRRETLNAALDNLSERERGIIAARRLDDPAQTLQALAKKYGVSIERVRQIEGAAMKKIAAFVKRQSSVVAE